MELSRTSRGYCPKGQLPHGCEEWMRASCVVRSSWRVKHRVPSLLCANTRISWSPLGRESGASWRIIVSPGCYQKRCGCSIIVRYVHVIRKVDRVVNELYIFDELCGVSALEVRQVNFVWSWYRAREYVASSWPISRKVRVSREVSSDCRDITNIECHHCSVPVLDLRESQSSVQDWASRTSRQISSFSRPGLSASWRIIVSPGCIRSAMDARPSPGTCT